jgi:hypothetical protein
VTRTLLAWLAIHLRLAWLRWRLARLERRVAKTVKPSHQTEVA